MKTAAILADGSDVKDSYNDLKKAYPQYKLAVYIFTKE
jgi:hypothetical protein